VTVLGNGPPDSIAFAAAGALSTVVEHPAANSMAVKPAAAIPANTFFDKLFILVISFCGAGLAS